MPYICMVCMKRLEKACEEPPGGLAHLRRCGALVLRSKQSETFLERVAPWPKGLDPFLRLVISYISCIYLLITVLIYIY